MGSREQRQESGEESGARRAGWGAGELREGSLIAGRYRVEEKLGHGGMGDVYRVCEQRTGRRLALKRHRRDAADDERRANLGALFEREYHSLAQLAHPRIIEVHDYGVDVDNTPFYTMELLDGEDLHRRGARPWPEACRLLLDVASSLAILHTRRLLHRDLTPRNVRCTSDGRAKLIDFGATVPMGAVKTVAGSPKFIAPEALEEQALDARSDLYSLGVLAYWLLTGRYPYAVKTFAALRDAWRVAPPSPVELVPEIPEGLDHLVMELLQVDRNARPASAAEVMERLSAVARMPLSEPPAVPNAYLVTPPLIGRAELLSCVRKQLMRSCLRGGRTLLIEGCAGSGRSRMLDACALDAKLLGMSVLRADASDGARGAYGVAGKLCAALLDALPEAAQRAATPRRALLSHVCERFAHADGAPSLRLGRQQLQAVVLEFWQEVAESTPIVIAVDDVDRIDAPSAALLAAVAHLGVRCRITVIATRCSGEPADPATRLVCDAAKRFELSAFDREQTEALLRAVFGDVQHLAPVAACVHALTSGNPLQTMTLSESLVTRGLARYEAGGWKLPPTIARDALPESMASEWRGRMAALAPDALELAVALALVEPGALCVAQYPALLDHGDSGRCYRALDGLVTNGIVAPVGQHHRLVQREVAVALVAELPEARRRALHARVARALDQHANRLLAIEQLFLAGCPAEAIARLLRLGEAAEIEPSLRAMSLLEQAVDAAPALNLGARRQLQLTCWLVTMAAMLGERTTFMLHGLPLLDRLESACGLRDYLELSELPAAERLAAALERARIRHESEPEHTRGSSPLQALPQLARLCSATLTMGLLAQDVELLERLPSLEQLAALSPAFGVLDLAITAVRHMLAGRVCDAVGVYERVLVRMAEPDRAGFPVAHHQAMRLGVLYALSVFAAGYGLPQAGDGIAELEQEPGHRANAWRVRLIAALMRGDVASAQTCQRRAELLALEDGELLRYRGTTERVELLAHGMAADVLGIKGAMERIESVHAVYPGWAPTLALARSYYRRTIGDAAGALETVQSALLCVAPGCHMDWPLLAANEASLLSELGRHDEAIARALDTFAVYEREQLSGTTAYLLQVVAEVLHSAGRHARALSWADRCIESCEREQRHGLCLGSGYEIRARVAAALGDVTGFEDYAQRCAQEYQRGRSATLSAKYGRLIRYAQQLGVLASGETQSAVDWDVANSSSSELSSSAELVTRRRI